MAQAEGLQLFDDQLNKPLIDGRVDARFDDLNSTNDADPPA